MKKGNKKKDIERFEALRDAAAQIADGNFDIKKYYGITDDGLEAIYNIDRHVRLHNIWLGIILGHCCFLKCL